MSENIYIEIEKLRKKIKKKFYLGVWKGYAMQNKLNEYARTGKAHYYDGHELSEEQIEWTKRAFWIMAPEKFHEILPNENPENILRWAKYAVEFSEQCEKNPEILGNDEGLPDDFFLEREVECTEEERIASDKISHREEKLKRISHKRILNPDIKGRLFIMRDYDNQYPEIPSAYHLIKTNNGYSLKYVSVPKWYFGDEDYDNSKSDGELIQLQEVTIGYFIKNESKYSYKESGGWDLTEGKKSEINKSLIKIGFSFLPVN
jgi:hypothetical protein